MEKPFDMRLMEAMVGAGERTAKEIQGFKVGYHQSDEFTFLLSDTDSLKSEGWFGYELAKMVSVSASLFTANFNEAMGGTKAVFDSRAFNVPDDEAPNVFIWRQRDWERNSVMMLAQSMYSHKQLHGKNQAALHDLIHAMGRNWSDLPEVLKNGTFITKDGRRLFDKMGYQELTELIESQFHREI